MFFKKKSAAVPKFEPAVTVLAEDHDADLKQKSSDFLRKLDAGYYDFLDLGTCDGGGFTIAEKQGGRRGLGFDLSPPIVRQSLAKNLDVALYDVCDIKASGPRVDFAVCSHILEHLPDLPSIEKVLRSLSSLSRNYILISGPYFEPETYLEGLGLKVLHSLMLDHTCKVRIHQLIQILHRLELRDYVIALAEPIVNSDNIWVYAADQPVGPEGLWTYDKDQHRPKPKTAFEAEIYRDFVCVVKLAPAVNCDRVLQNFHWGYSKIVDRSTWKF